MPVLSSKTAGRSNRSRSTRVWWPFASAMDTALPEPPAHVHMMENYRCAWSTGARNPGDTHFPEYPGEAIVDWHERKGLLDPD